eukprot:548242-Pelagomonas_calceolata.AAC.4
MPEQLHAHMTRLVLRAKEGPEVIGLPLFLQRKQLTKYEHALLPRASLPSGGIPRGRAVHAAVSWGHAVMLLSGVQAANAASGLLAAQDIEFTVQEGKLFMLQCRGGKRTGQAAFKIAVDLVDEGVISEEEAMLMVRVVCASTGMWVSMGTAVGMLMSVG